VPAIPGLTQRRNFDLDRGLRAHGSSCARPT
jgi:hypothetical protein